MAALVFDSLRIDRGDLAEFLPNLRAIKAFERLQEAVATTIPDAVNNNTDSAAGASTEASLAQGAAETAQGAADNVARALDRLTEAVMTQRDYRSTIAQMQRQIDELRTILLGS